MRKWDFGIIFFMYIEIIKNYDRSSFVVSDFVLGIKIFKELEGDDLLVYGYLAKEGVIRSIIC